MPTAAEPFGEVRDRAVYLPEAGTLIVADLHLGKAAASAVDAPVDEGPAMVDRLGELLDRYEPTTVVLAGDVLHAFDHVPQAAREAVAALTARVADAGAEFVPLSGNHDAQLGALTADEPAAERRLADGTLVCHGHEAPNEEGDRYVCGHLHPAIEIEGRKRDCFLYDPAGYRGRPTLTLPAFSTFAAGLRIERRTAVDSPLVPDIDAVRPGVVTDEGSRASGAASADDDPETLWFPPLADLRPHLRR